MKSTFGDWGNLFKDFDHVIIISYHIIIVRIVLSQPEESKVCNSYIRQQADNKDKEETSSLKELYLAKPSLYMKENSITFSKRCQAKVN